MADIFGWLYSLIYKLFCSERIDGHCLSKDKKGIKENERNINDCFTCVSRCRWNG
ncbi:hypothetical protein ACMBCM_01135 [Spiroplasma sp. K1]